MRGQREQVVEAGDARGRRPARAARAAGRRWPSASSRARWLGRWSRRKRLGQRAELAVGHLVAHQPAGQRAGVDDAVGRAAAGRRRRSAAWRKPRSKRTLWPTITASPTNSSRVGSTVSIAGRRDHHRLGDAGEHGDLGRDGRTRVDEGLERAEALAAAQLDRADLGDGARRRRAAGGLEVDHAERDVVQRRAEVVEAALRTVGDRRAAVASGHPSTVYRTGVRRQGPVGAGVGTRRGSDRAVPAPRYRCTACGNLTRFDVTDHPPHPGVPPLHRGRRALGRGRRGARRGGRGGHVPVVRACGQGRGDLGRRAGLTGCTLGFWEDERMGTRVPEASSLARPSK